jgi:hypothetical protein
MMAEDEYRAYLLRLWRVEDNGKRWRARLEDIGTGESLGFGSLGQLLAFLQRLGDEGDQPGKEGGEKTDDL